MSLISVKEVTHFSLIGSALELGRKGYVVIPSSIDNILVLYAT